MRAAVITPSDEQRSLDSVREAIEGRYNGDPFQRVIYSESHDEVANGKARVASEIDPHDPDSWFAQKRTTLAAALVLTAPGIPMLFQGQEFLEDGWFQDSVPLDWHKSEEFSGLVRMYRDLIHLRLNRSGSTRGLSGSGLNTFHQNQADNVIAYHRWHQGGPGDDVVVVVNLSHRRPRELQAGVSVAGNVAIAAEQRLEAATAAPLETRLAPMWSPEPNEATSRRTRSPRSGMASPPRERSTSGRTVC